MISTQVKPPRRDASRFEDRVAARPDRAVVLAAAGALAATVLTHYSAAALPLFAAAAAYAARRLRAQHASSCVELKILPRVRAESSRRPPRRRRDACSMA